MGFAALRIERFREGAHLRVRVMFVGQSKDGREGAVQFPVPKDLVPGLVAHTDPEQATLRSVVSYDAAGGILDHQEEINLTRGELRHSNWSCGA